MPRKTINPSEKIEYLSILDENARLDKDLKPDIEPTELLKLHWYLLLERRFDEQLLNLQRQGNIGTSPPIKGQEAAHLGAVASQIPHAVGLAWAAKYRQPEEVVMTFFRDGATSEGDFHEGLNFAGVFQAPLVFICQINQWAISIPLKQQTHSQTIAQKAIACGMPAIQVDGNNLLAAYVAAGEAVERARSGSGRTLLGPRHPHSFRKTSTIAANPLYDIVAGRALRVSV